MPRSISPVVYRPTTRNLHKCWFGPGEWLYVPPSLMANPTVVVHHRGAAVDYLVPQSLPAHAHVWPPMQSTFTYHYTRREQ